MGSACSSSVSAAPSESCRDNHDDVDGIESASDRYRMTSEFKTSDSVSDDSVYDDDSDVETPEDMGEAVRELKACIRRLGNDRYPKMRSRERDLRYIHASIFSWTHHPDDSDVDRFCRKLVKLPFLQLYKVFVTKVQFNMLFDVDDDDEENKSQLVINTAIIGGLTEVVMTATDKSTAFCERFLQLNVHQEIFNYLRHLQQKQKSNLWDDSVVEMAVNMLFVLENIIILHSISNARELFRNCGAINVLDDLRRDQNKILSLVALSVLAFILNENENEKLNSDKKSFKLLIKWLDCAMNGVRLEDSYVTSKPIELMKVINQLAQNDKNKELIVEAGALSRYAQLLKDDEPQVQSEAAHGLWYLAFKFPEKIKNDEQCMAELNKLKSHSDEEVSRWASGALFTIEGYDQIFGTLAAIAEKSEGHAQETDINTANRSRSDGHVLISYERSTNKQMVLKIRDRIKNAGFPYYFDDEHMVGDCMEAMGRAVKGAAVIVICLSRGYQASANCRAELQTGFKQKKKIVPVRVEANFATEEFAPWIEIALGSDIVLNFGYDHMFESSIEKLLMTIKEKLAKKDGDW